MALLAEEPVGQRRLPHVGPPDNRHADRWLRLVRPFGWQTSNDSVEQVPTPLAHGGRDAERLSEAELIELILRSGPLQVVELVHCQQHRAVGLPKSLGDGAINGEQSLFAID